jgi:hypothetical protein
MVIDHEILLYNKFTSQGQVNAAIRLQCTTRHNALSVATIEVDADHFYLSQLQSPAARVKVREAGKRIMDGRITKWSASGVGSRDTVIFTAHSPFEIFKNMRGWPVPANTLGLQNVENYIRTGPAETVLKDIVRANALRLGIPLTILPDQGRGAIITVSLRFQPLEEKLFPLFDQAGIGVDVWMGESTYVLDCYTSTVYPHELSEIDGTITGGSYSSTGPTVTRVVVGGQGEGVQREFRQYIDAAREAEWGVVIEEFQDARDSDDGNVFDARATEVLAEGAPVSGLSLELSGAESLKLGVELNLGNIATAEIRGQQYTEEVREIIRTYDENGRDVKPVLGERADDPNRTLAKKLRAQSKGNNDRIR